MYQQRQQARHRDQGRVAESLARRNALRSGLSKARAADIIWALANPHTFHALAGERGWAIDEYEHWLAQLLASALLNEASA
jgi:hypothetical protein